MSMKKKEGERKGLVVFNKWSQLFAAEKMKL